MGLVTVTGGPTAPTGKTLASAALVAFRPGEYVDGVRRYPSIYRAELDALTLGWKPEGAPDGTPWTVPAEGPGDPTMPDTRFTETQRYTDDPTRGHSRTFSAAVTDPTGSGRYSYIGADPATLSDTSAVLTVGTVTAGGTAIACGTALAIVEILVQNPYTNSNDVLVGSASAQTIVLRPGTDSGWIRIDDRSKLYVKAVSGSPVLNYMARGD